MAAAVWVEPYPEEMLSGGGCSADPDASCELRDCVELAFVAALQCLPAMPRAVLILREVLAFSAAEVVTQPDTTVASVNSAAARPQES